MEFPAAFSTRASVLDCGSPLPLLNASHANGGLRNPTGWGANHHGQSAGGLAHSKPLAISEGPVIPFLIKFR